MWGVTAWIFFPSGQNKGSEEENLKRWQLSLMGVGCTICTGFFSQLLEPILLLAKMTADLSATMQTSLWALGQI
ncbi:hypothetical protein SC499_18750 [Peribacillus simplex]|uniref:hypothetical protein n=1 Tax=Peribacillus simplex TaxID=1478 RepID=UPI00298D720B|nr:hypothetical protein [Peribacillus simplex]MDW7616696.1 hypothetical protein [Peribacillus simplex]